MRRVAIKSAAQQADALTLSARELLAAVAQDAEVPQAAGRLLAFLGQQVAHLDREIAKLEVALMAQHQANPVSRLLAEIPGIGVPGLDPGIGALTLAVRIDPRQFQSGRHLAAWIGLTPREHSSGGKQRMGGISRAGDERLRQLLVLGATAIIRYAKPGRASVWLLSLLERRLKKLAAVALANKACPGAGRGWPASRGP
jgi:transposase